jgi:NAD(P)-dependent dehydrogenase (short-subunit alcohol dehydrogenase family)
MEVKNKIVIVTGAGSGIGKATAIHFAKHGAIVVVSDRKSASANKVVELIVKDGGTALQIEADVTNFEAVENLVAQTVKEFGRLDVIVNNAGIGP